ncbi:hypothetical protein FNH21_10780 [Arthrobacter sp. KR32]|uniref:EcsC family protein n=2 Tax=Arthrobacter bussei TaxID=2594179 RepID=A0A7X1NQZ6_9MICC|nr:EcsC family protein [Arthrobacter bussei]MPY11195.1 hypothetical protein [Arthrobacter bussei]
MSAYELQVWSGLDRHWERRNNHRGLPNWAGVALSKTRQVAGTAANKVGNSIPDVVTTPLNRAGEAVADRAGRPAVEAAIALLQLVNDWAMELNDPTKVELLARKQGLTFDTFADLRDQDLKSCDRLLTGNTLRWRTTGALEGGVMGLLALIPVAGIPIAMTADLLVIQVLSTSIASRIAYSYGFDAKDPDEQLFIQRLVRRSFVAQAGKAEPLRRVAGAAGAVKGRVNWSPKLRADHRLLTAIEALMKQLGPVGATVPLQNVAKVVPFIGIVIGTGTNSAVLGNVAADARRYCQTRFLCEKYGMPLPAALHPDLDDESA